MDYPNFESIDFNFRRSFVTFLDFPVLLLLLIIGIFLFNELRRKSPGIYGSKPHIFYGAYFLHMFGAVFITLIYSYYYEGGDTTAYFNDARLLQKIFWHDPATGLDIFFSSPQSLSINHPFILSSFRFLAANDTFMVVRICFLIQFFSFNLILPTALLFGYLSFYASWKFYLLVTDVYPQLSKALVIPIFFIPGIHVWGSGIFKDTLALALLYLIVVSIYGLAKRKRYADLVRLIASLYLLLVIKIYVLMALALGFFCFFIVFNLNRTKKIALKALILPILIFLGLGGFFYSFKVLGENSRKGIYSFDQIFDRAEIVANYLGYVSEKSDGSSYNLGIADFTIPNLIKKIPAGVNVTLFRPYLWEVKNPLMLAAAIESGLILLFTIYVILKIGFLKFFERLLSSPMIITIFVYSLSFAFAIGITSNNFGTLTRYKIPIVPFYVIGLILILYSNRIKNFGAESKAIPSFFSRLKDKIDRTT